MVETLSANDFGLPAFLRSRARQASTARVLLDISLGFTAVLTAIMTRPPWWLQLACAGAAFTSFGLWVMLDRIRESHPATGRVGTLVGLTQALIALCGFGASAALVFFLWASAIGTWIS